MASDLNLNIERSQVEARQGSTRPQLIYVLVFGIALVIVGFAVAWFTTRH